MKGDHVRSQVSKSPWQQAFDLLLVTNNFTNKMDWLFSQQLEIKNNTQKLQNGPVFECSESITKYCP